MYKITTFASADKDGHPLIRILNDELLEKTAGYKKDVEDFIAGLQKEADHTYILVNAMTSGDFYGPNLNGDYFPDEQLLKYHKTFEKNAHFFRHHKNKNIDEAAGKVIYASHNPDMHRVELVIALDNKKSTDILEALNAGELFPVSMGVRTPSDKCLATTTKIYTEHGIKLLKDITVEDKIFTHTGNIRNIEATSQQTLDKYVEIGIFGDYEYLQGSPEHPFYIVPKKSFTKYGTIRKQNNTIPVPEWQNMEDLSVGDYLIFKRSIKNLTIITPSYARILGYYISEGSIIRERVQINYKKTGSYKTMGVRFSFNLDERYTYAEDLNQILLQEGFVAKIYESTKKHECTIVIYSKELALFLIKYGGEYSHTKRIHPDIFRHSEDIILNVLGSAINGDGSQDHNKHKGTIRYSSVSEQLARDIRRLALEVGIPASINRYNCDPSDFSLNGCIIYIVYIPASASSILTNYSSKCKEYKISSGSRLFVFPEFTLIPITKIEEIIAPLQVANLQVSEDESYQALDYVTHNCSICGNRSKNIHEYCDHLKYEMRRVLPDGRRVMAINDDRLNFFDISKVRIPADRVASTIAKIASAEEIDDNEAVTPSAVIGEEFLKESGLKESALTKEMPTAVEAFSADPNNLILDSQKKLPIALLDKVAEQYSLKDILSTFLGLRVMPRPEEFQRLVLINMNRKPYADQVLERGAIVMDMEEMPQIPIDVTIDGFNHELAANMLEYLPEVAMTKPLIIRRVMIKRADIETSNQGLVGTMIKKIPTVGEPKGPRPSMYAPAKNPMFPMIGLGGLYAGFGALMNKLKASPETYERFGSYDKFLLQNPWLVPLFVGAVAMGTEGVSSLLFHKKEAAAGEAVIKKFPDVAKKLLVAVPASYLYAGHIENKLQKGQPISKFEDLVRKHPFLAGAGAMGAHGWAWPHIKKDLGIGTTKVANYLGSLDRVVYGLGPEKFEELYNDVVGITNP